MDAQWRLHLKTLTPTERNYAQIEKETLAILFGCIWFEQYILGREITVESDHKPLLAIVKKSLLTIPKRLQRMFLALQRYSYNIHFVPGSKLYMADALSRLHLFKNLRIIDERVEEIRHATIADDNMLKLTEYIVYGFPDSKDDVPECLQPYLRCIDELTTQNGINFKV